jgi:predicted aldo/keto reductase-like oxidoreductase
MNYRRLGRTGLTVSVVGVGTTQLRRIPERQAIATLKRAFELGVNHVNVGPDYEGADDLVLAALRESPARQEVYVSIQAGGDVAYIQRLFEETCEKFQTERLDLFGLAAISEQEVFGHNVWGRGGTVEFLQRMKSDGRLRAMFASDHGSPEHMRTVLERDVFDALMLAYNPLGFHIISFRPDTVWKIETPPLPLQGTYEWEDIPRTRREIFPLAKRRDVGLMVMKPLAGGLLTSSKAFPPRAYREDLPPPLAGSDVLRYVLMQEGVSCVVPGTCSVEEAEENAAAGCGDLELEAAVVERVETRTGALTRTLCSRCGKCDDLCSKGLPVSFIFRAAYHYLYPSAPFEVSSNLQYFKLHPWERSACESCENRTCVCPAGIDIPGEMIAIHRRMVELRAAGEVPAGDRGAHDWASGRPFGFKLLSMEAPSSLRHGEQGTVRLHVRNVGTQPWLLSTPPGGSAVALNVFFDGRRIETVRLRHDVWPAGSCHFAFSLPAPAGPGAHELRMQLFEDAPPILATIRVAEDRAGAGRFPVQ